MEDSHFPCYKYYATSILEIRMLIDITYIYILERNYAMEDQTTNQEKREVAYFNRLINHGIGNVILTQGDHEELIIEADAEIRQRIRTEVRDETLLINFDFGWQDLFGLNFIGRGPIRFLIMMKDIQALKLSGAGNIEARSIKADKLELALSGAGNLRVDALTSKELICMLSGAGNISASGSTVTAQIQLSGAGSFHGDSLEIEDAKVIVSGAGSAKLKVTKKLDGSISGVGSVDYTGSPEVTSRVSGMGSIKKIS
jgi:hypothetical protein